MSNLAPNLSMAQAVQQQQQQQQVSQQQQQQQQQQSSQPSQLSSNIGGIGGGVPPSSIVGAGGGLQNLPPSVVNNFPSRLYTHVLELTQSEKREAALLELSKKREDFPDLAPILWHSFGTIAALLQEIVSIYPLLCPEKLTPGISNRCCNALALLQCVASHPDTRSLFLNCKSRQAYRHCDGDRGRNELRNFSFTLLILTFFSFFYSFLFSAHLGLFLYPFLNTVCTLRQYEYLRLTSLGVIGALVKVSREEQHSMDRCRTSRNMRSDDCAPANIGIRFC